MGAGPGAITAVLMVLGLTAGVAGAPGAEPPVRGDRLGSAEDQGRADVFEPGPGQEYELAFFITAAVMTMLVAGGFVVVIIVHGRGSRPEDREATPDEIEA